jgi:superfamily II DNA or RNA helicase
VHFLTPDRLIEGGPRRFNVAIERLLLHAGFDDVRNIDGAGDGGGDLLATLGKERFVFQCKWTGGRTIARSGVDEVERAKGKYRADRAVVVTNARPSTGALRRRDELARVNVRVDLWGGQELSALYDAVSSKAPTDFQLRPYQGDAVEAVVRDLRARRRALLVLATGLGKTVVGGEVIARLLADTPEANVLVVAHMKDLVRQLERALWRHLPKHVPTQVLTGDDRPRELTGVTCATIESALVAVYEGYRADLVMVDETHHVGEIGQYQRLLDALDDAAQFGVTATPWRGDRYDIGQRFGPASFTMGIAEGMAAGYLAQVDYSLYVDNIDWDIVRNASACDYSVKELNDKLFLPERDEAVIDHLHSAWTSVVNPRAIVFCQTIEHAERVAALLSRASPLWARASCMHSGQSKRERDVLMADFRLGRVPIIAARDIFNEGVDVPDVNIICFLRVTHSRRIFVQQLGRGLRLREGKASVRVLDFITDIRRVAAALNIRRTLQGLEAGAPDETLELGERSTIEFSDAAVGSIMEAWINDAADLETAADEVRLEFPDVAAHIQ